MKDERCATCQYNRARHNWYAAHASGETHPFVLAVPNAEVKPAPAPEPSEDFAGKFWGTVDEKVISSQEAEVAALRAAGETWAARVHELKAENAALRAENERLREEKKRLLRG